MFVQIEDKDPDEGVLYQRISGDFKKLFEKEKKLGEGTCATVFRARRRATGEIVAVKQVKTRDDEMIFQIKEEFRFMKN